MSDYSGFVQLALADGQVCYVRPSEVAYVGPACEAGKTYPEFKVPARLVTLASGVQFWATDDPDLFTRLRVFG